MEATPLQYCPLTDVWGQAHTLGTQLQRVVLQRILVVFCYLSKNHQDYSLQQDRAMSSIYKHYLIYVHYCWSKTVLKLKMSLGTDFKVNKQLAYPSFGLSISSV